jgi:hypothetical protein
VKTNGSSPILPKLTGPCMSGFSAIEWLWFGYSAGGASNNSKRVVRRLLSKRTNESAIGS